MGLSEAVGICRRRICTAPFARRAPGEQDTYQRVGAGDVAYVSPPLENGAAAGEAAWLRARGQAVAQRAAGTRLAVRRLAAGWAQLRGGRGEAELRAQGAPRRGDRRARVLLPVLVWPPPHRRAGREAGPAAAARPRHAHRAPGQQGPHQRVGAGEVAGVRLRAHVAHRPRHHHHVARRRQAHPQGPVRGAWCEPTDPGAPPPAAASCEIARR